MPGTHLTPLYEKAFFGWFFDLQNRGHYRSRKGSRCRSGFFFGYTLKRPPLDSFHPCQAAIGGGRPLGQGGGQARVLKGELERTRCLLYTIHPKKKTHIYHYIYIYIIS